MKLSTSLARTCDPKQAARLSREPEAAGIDMLWVAELSSFDLALVEKVRAWAG